MTNEPQQMDLIGGSEPEVVAESATVLMGTYRQARLEFVPDAPTDGRRLLDKSECGTTLGNCIVKGDGRVDAILWAGNMPELVVRGVSMGDGELVVLPDTMVLLRVSLEPQRVFSSSASEPWAWRVVLAGHADAVRQKTAVSQ